MCDRFTARSSLTISKFGGILPANPLQEKSIPDMKVRRSSR